MEQSALEVGVADSKDGGEAEVSESSSESEPEDPYEGWPIRGNYSWSVQRIKETFSEALDFASGHGIAGIAVSRQPFFSPAKIFVQLMIEGACEFGVLVACLFHRIFDADLAAE